VILVDDRDGLQKYLNEKGVGTGLHYPVPLHLQKAYAYKGYKEGDFPVTESVAKRLLSLPMFPELTKAQIEYVAQTIKEFMTH
jgi:dTDP-4-amino-4,6-dideoxygalactose transaminase